MTEKSSEMFCFSSSLTASTVAESRDLCSLYLVSIASLSGAVDGDGRVGWRKKEDGQTGVRGEYDFEMATESYTYTLEVRGMAGAVKWEKRLFAEFRFRSH